MNPDDGLVLAEFVLALQSLDTSGGPPVQPGHRAGAVDAYDLTARAALNAAGALQATGRIEPDLFDAERAASVWAAAVQAPKWQGTDVWVHSDFMASNLVTLDGRLNGVLDFGGLAVGDPAGNAMAASMCAAPLTADLDSGPRLAATMRPGLGPVAGPLFRASRRSSTTSTATRAWSRWRAR